MRRLKRLCGTRCGSERQEFGRDLIVNRVGTTQPHWRKALPVMDRGPKARQRLDMLRHGVTHVALEAIARMNQCEARHQPVARYLGNDRCRRDRGHNGVATDNCLTVAATVDTVTTIDEDELRAHRQCYHGPRQRPQRGAQDVVAVDPRRWRHRDRNFGASADLGIELLARVPVELLGIVEAARHASWNKNDGGSYDRACQRPTSGLVAACDRPGATLERGALAAERRPGLFLPERQADRACDGWACDGIATHAMMVRSARRKSMRLHYRVRAEVKSGDNRRALNRAAATGRPRRRESADCAQLPRDARLDLRSKRYNRPRTQSARTGSAWPLRQSPAPMHDPPLRLMCNSRRATSRENRLGSPMRSRHPSRVPQWARATG